MKKIKTHSLIKKLAWESDFFQMNCAEVENIDMSLSQEALNMYDWVQGRVSIEDKKKINSFEEHGFKFEDLRITLQKKQSLAKITKYHQNIRKAEIQDTSILTKIAKETLVKNSRFISIVGIDKTISFYEKWVSNSIIGVYNDFCYVIEYQNEIAGFITLSKHNNTIEIGLLAIDTQFHSYGLGKSLITFAEKAALEMECTSLCVVAAGKNIQAIQFYIAQGFNIETMESWYYKY